jgi:hypothetical protein
MNREYDQLKQIVVRKTEICNKRNIKKRKKSNSEILLRMRSKKMKKFTLFRAIDERERERERVKACCRSWAEK